MDAFLYLGSRLADGELLYIKDFETKLPLLQYLFFFAHKLGGIGAWRIITLLFSLFFSAAAAKIYVSDHPSEPHALNHDDKSAIVFLTGVFLLILYSLPGSESAEIEMIPAASMFLAFAMATSNGAMMSTFKIPFICGILTAFSASIRPNYIYVTISFILIFLLSLRESGLDLATPTKKDFSFLFGFSGFIFLSFSPYLFVNHGIPSLIDGLKAIARFPMHINALQLILAQSSPPTEIFYIGVYSGTIILLLKIITNRNDSSLKKRDFNRILFCCTSLIFLNMSFISSHYYSHYSMMLVPFAMPIVFYSYKNIPKIGLIIKSHSELNIRGTILKTLVLISFFSLLILPAKSLFKNVNNIDFSNKNAFFSINHRNTDDNLLRLLAGLKSQGVSFFVSDNPIYHALLNQPRLGDGHPSMLKDVLKGRKIGPIDNIYLYSDEVHKNPCLALFNSQKDVILTSANHELDKLITSCLSSEKSPYVRSNFISLSAKSSEINGKNLRKYRFFIRKDRINAIAGDTTKFAPVVQ